MGTALSGLFTRNIPGGLLILPQPCADAPFPGTLPARELFAEILGLEDLADLDLGLVTRMRARAFPCPRDGLVERGAFPDPEARDQVLGLREWAIHDRALVVLRKFDARAFRARMKPVGSLDDAGVDELLVETAHFFEEFRVRHHDELVRLEIAPAELDRALDRKMTDELARRFRALGFRYVTLDLHGYRTGAMNEVLKTVTGDR